MTTTAPAAIIDGKPLPDPPPVAAARKLRWPLIRL
jgi:hypothetical protein